MSKIAVCSEGPGLDDLLDPRFGRAAGFIIIDPDTMAYEYLDNGKSQVISQGAGIQAAETVARSGVEAVLTGSVGPKAFMALQAVGIKVGQNLGNITVRQALERYRSGKVEWAAQPNRQGHWK
jgi:predicted Fe-Mo cluster-binding NifX family protein